MTCATVAFSDAALFDGGAFTLRDCRRGIFGGAVIGVATMTAACVLAALVMVAAAWIVGACLSANPYIHARASIGPQTIALDYRYPALAGAADVSVRAPFSTDGGHASDSGLEVPPAPAAGATFSADHAAAASTKDFTDHADDALFSPHPLIPAQIQTMHGSARGADSTPQPASIPAASTASSPTIPTVRSSEPAKRKPSTQPVEVTVAPPAASNSQKPLPAPQARRDSNPLLGPDSHTAIYDIEAHTVYLPDGDTLEAHSGLGKRLDDPRFVSEKNRGPTPPNVYDLVLRSEPFHGVRAIRLNPVGEGNMFGRDGMLAHTYMLGPSGQSFGCVSFRDYHAFLQAFLEGEINRLVVVPHLKATASRPTVLRHSRDDRYALDHG
jgi:hypothetical protein